MVRVLDRWLMFDNDDPYDRAFTKDVNATDQNLTSYEWVIHSNMSDDNDPFHGSCVATNFALYLKWKGSDSEDRRWLAGNREHKDSEKVLVKDKSSLEYSQYQWSFQLGKPGVWEKGNFKDANLDQFQITYNRGGKCSSVASTEGLFCKRQNSIVKDGENLVGRNSHFQTQTDIDGEYLAIQKGRAQNSWIVNNIVIDENEDFEMIAKLKVDGSDNSAASFYINTDYFGFDGKESKIFASDAFGSNLDETAGNFFNTTDFDTHNARLFTFRVERVDGRISFYIDENKEPVGSHEYENAIDTFIWRPNRANLKLYEWKFVINSDPQKFVVKNGVNQVSFYERDTDSDGNYLKLFGHATPYWPVWADGWPGVGPNPNPNLPIPSGEDFVTIVKMKIEGSMSNAAFFINDNIFLFNEHEDKIVIAKIFVFKIKRVNGLISFYIDDNMVLELSDSKEVWKFNWRPWEAKLKIYEWTYNPSYSSSDFIAEGYLNENQTNVIPSSCHDKPGASCTLEICDVEKLVIKVSDETTLFPGNHWKMKASGEGIAYADTFHLISNDSSPLEICLSDTSWSVGGTSIFKGMKCHDFVNDAWCGTIMALDDSVNMGKSIKEACCVCGGSKSFTTYPSLVPTNAPTISHMPTAPTSQPTACVDDSNWYLHEGTGLGCASITEDMCNRFVDYVYNKKSLKDACCICGGGKHRSVIPSLAPTNQKNGELRACHRITLNTTANIINKGKFNDNDVKSVSDEDGVLYWSVTGSDPWAESNNWKITLPIAENEDFATIAKLKIERLVTIDAGSAAVFYLDEGHFGFDGAGADDSIFSNVFNLVNLSKFDRPINKVFTFKVERKSNHIKFFIDDVLVGEKRGYDNAINTLEWGPYRANLKIYDWTFIPPNDFTLDGYMNEEGTNVIPRSCYDTLDDSCNLDICGVDEVVVKSTVGPSRAFFSNRGRNQINPHTYIRIGEKYGIGGSSTIPFALDTPNVQPYIEILQNGNLVARAWNGKQYVIIYEAGETFECEDGKQPIALFHGNTGLVAGCSDSGGSWGKYTIAGTLEERACSIAFLNGNLVCLSNTGDIRRTYGGDENILGTQYKDEMLVDEVTSTFEEGVSNYQCHDIELKRLTNSIGTSATELNIRSRNNEGTVPDGSFDFAIGTRYYLQDSLDLRTENDDNLNPFIVFQGDFNIVVYFSGCGAIASLRTNPSDPNGNGVGCRKDYKASFTNDGRILFQCTKDNDEPYSYYYPKGENENGLNDRNEVCKLKFFDGRGVCMFPDGNIAYALTNYWWIPQKCALAKSFKIPGYTNANPSLGNSIPETCAGNGSSCQLRVCGVDTLRVPASGDVSMYTFFDESGIMHIFENNDENLNPYYEFPFGTCKDVDDWTVGGTSMYSGMTCNDFFDNTWCETIMALDDSVNMGKSIKEACCVCGGSALFTTNPSVSPTNAPTISHMPTAPTAAPTTCENDEWFLDEEKRLGCASITEDMCNRFEGHIQNRKSAKEACCVCGGGKHRSVIPSLAPTNQPSYLPTLTPTISPSDQPSTVFSKNLAQAQPILDTLQHLSIQVGNWDSVSAYPVDDTTLSSLFGDTGFFISKNKSRSIELHGNAWKLFKLPEKYSVTSNTQLTLDIEVEDKANGHLICFAEEISEDLNFDDKNCLSLIDTNAEMWSNAKKAYNLALRKTATAPTSFSWLGSSNAIDGLSSTFSLVRGQNGNDAWIMLDLGESQNISSIEISSIFGLPQSLDVTIDQSETWTFENGKVDFISGASTRYLNVTSSDNLLISNIEVIGSNDLLSITYPLAVLFDGCETKFQYVALVQDSSSDTNKGISTISNIQFSETDSIADDNQTQNHENALEGTYFRLSHITSKKKLSIGGIKSASNSRVAFLSNTTPFEMSQVFLLEQGGTVQSLQFPEYYLGIDDNCKIEFAKMKNEELMSFEWLLDPNNSNNIFIQCQGEFKALTVVDDMLTLGPVPSKEEQNQHWNLMINLSEEQNTFISALEESSTCHQITLNIASNIINKGKFITFISNDEKSESDEDGQYWSVTGSGSSNESNNWNITLPIAESEDFETIAKLKIERLNVNTGSAASFYLDGDQFGFDSANFGESIFSRVFSLVELRTNLKRPLNKVFTFKVERKNNHIKFFFDGVFVSEKKGYDKAINTLQWSPNRANLKIYDWTFIPSSDFTLDGYMNEEGTNVIPKSCHGSTCKLEVCGFGIDTNQFCSSMDSNDVDYRGTISTTSTGETCYPWTDNTNWNGRTSTSVGQGLESNYCRNPTTREKPNGVNIGAWCYTEKDTNPTLCSIPKCTNVSHQCHDIELKRLEEPMGISQTEYSIRTNMLGNDDDIPSHMRKVPSGPFEFEYNKAYYLEGDDAVTPRLIFQGDKNFMAYLGSKGIANLGTNSLTLNGRAFFTNEGRILVKYYNATTDKHISERMFPDSDVNGLNEKNELCRLRYFDGQVVCMFSDGKIAYTLPGYRSNQEWARSRSFKIPGYTNPHPSLGNSIPETCAENGSTCHLRVCGVDTLRVPSSVDVSRFEILNDSGKSLRRTWHREDNFFEYELMSTAFGGRSVFPTTPISIQIDTYESTGRASLSRRRLALESSNSDMSRNTLDMNRSMISVDMNDDKSLVQEARSSSEMKNSKYQIEPGTVIGPINKAHYIGGPGSLAAAEDEQAFFKLDASGKLIAYATFYNRGTKQFETLPIWNTDTDYSFCSYGFIAIFQNDSNLVLGCKKENENALLDHEIGFGYSVASSEEDKKCSLTYLQRQVVCMDDNGKIYYRLGGDNVQNKGRFNKKPFQQVDYAIKSPDLPYQVEQRTGSECPMNFEVEYGDCLHAVRTYHNTRNQPYSKYCVFVNNFFPGCSDTDKLDMRVVNDSTNFPAKCSFKVNGDYIQAVYNFASTGKSNDNLICKKGAVERRLAAYTSWSYSTIKPGTWIEPGVKYYIGGAGTLEPKSWTQPWIILTTGGYFEAWHEFQFGEGINGRNIRLFRFDFTKLKINCPTDKGWGGYLQFDRHLIFACNKGNNELDTTNWISNGLKIDQYSTPGYGGTYDLGSSCALVYLNRKVVCMDKRGNVYYRIGSGLIPYKNIKHQALPYEVVPSRSCPVNFEVEFGDCLSAVRKHTNTMTTPYNKYCSLHEKQYDYRGNIKIGTYTDIHGTSEDVACTSGGYCRNNENSMFGMAHCRGFTLQGLFLTTIRVVCNVPMCTFPNYLDMKVISSTDEDASKYPEKCSYRTNRDGFVQAVYNFGSSSTYRKKLCKKNSITYDVELRTDGISKCPANREIPKQHCWSAALELKNTAYDKDLPLYQSTSNQDPCGCFIANDGKIKYRDSQTSCGTTGNLVCKQAVKYFMPNLDPLRCLGREKRSLTMVNCTADSTDHKWFFDIDSNEKISLWTRPNEDTKHCLQSNLSIVSKSNGVACDLFKWKFLQNGQIQNDSNSKVIEYDSATDTVSLQDLDKLNPNQKWFISDRYVKRQSEHLDAHFKGSYQNGIFFQDHTGFVRVQNEEVHLFGNSWKLFEFTTERVHFRTKLLFRYKILENAEDHFICFGTNYHHHVSKETKRNCVKLGGLEDTQLNDSQRGSSYQVGLEDDDGWKTLSIPIFDLLKDETLTPEIDYIAFIQNNDATPLHGHSAFSEFRLSTIELGTPSFSCDNDFIAADDEGMRPTKILNVDKDFCVRSNLKSLVSYEENSVKFDTRGFNLDSLKLYEAKDSSIEVSNKTEKTSDEVSFDVATKDSAGKKFLVQNNGTNPFQFYFITKCSGVIFEDTNDLTGAPRNFVSYQEKGHVRFRFMDNSLCEDGFAFTRFDDPASREFLQKDFFDEGVTFSPIFYFSGKDDVGEEITPETEASDDLTLSRLGVGEEYGYCIRAVHRDRYMDTMELENTDIITTKTSSSTCHVHKIRWESSINGKITTEPNAGTLPIKHVRIDYELMTEMQEPIECDGCSGTVYTDDGGSFDIDFNVDHPLLKGKGSTSIPVKLKYSKVTKFGQNTIDHVFLCNNGLDFCDNGGNLVYLKHLHFEEPVHVYDDTSVPFRGKLFYHNTRFPGSEGCPVVDAEVCLMHNTTATVENPVPSEYELVCVKSNSLGEYNAPIIMGSVVHAVKVRHHEHQFGKSLHNHWNYEEGILIGDNEIYSGHDFVDETKATLRVEVVGGECSKPLGSSTVRVSIEGCDWHGDTYDYSGVQKIYNNVPATLVNVQVTSNEYPHIEAYFQNGDSPDIRTINLRDENKMEEEIENDGNQPATTGSATASSQDQQELEAEATEAEEKQISLVRFQYDGTLAMDVQFTNGVEDITSCANSTFISPFVLQFTENGDSFHVTTKNEEIDFIVNLKFEIIKTEEENVSCDIVGDDYIVTMRNNIGGNCLEECTLQVKHDEDEEGKKIGGAHAEFEEVEQGEGQKILAGDPNVIYPFTKNIFFRVSGNGASVSHNAHFFIQGLFTKGEGKSFALPDRKPVMILRDPPGGLSYAKFENVQTSMKIVKESTSISWGTGLEIDPEVGVDEESKMCTGLGAAVCKKLLGTKGTVKIGFEGSLGGDVKDYEEEKSNKFSTTWSYTTSTSPDKAGPMSDVFVVPNVFVAVQTYTIVAWDPPLDNESPDGKCKPYQEDDGEFPTYTDFTIDNAQTALAFYSRHHIINVKIPELESAIKSKEDERDRMKEGDAYLDSCCNEPPCTQFGVLRTCTENDWNEANRDITALESAMDDWSDARDYEGENVAIDEFFGSNPLHKINNEGKLLSIDNHPSGLIPGFYATNYCGNGKTGNGICEQKCHLCDEDGNCIDRRIMELFCPEEYQNEYSTRLERLKRDLKRNRMQFSGGGGIFEMSMSHDYSSSKSGRSCWHGCPVDHETKLKLKMASEQNIFGFKAEYTKTPTLLSLHTVHTSNEGGSVERATSVSFGLGDEHIGDEFVVDVNYDKRYGTVVFDTVAGISRCPHEEGTLPAEDPQLTLLQLPSPYVDPETPMLFEIEIANLGEGKGNFQLEAVQGKDYLVIVVDGTEITEAGISLTVPSHDKKIKTVALHRDPIAFHYDPIKMFLKTCDSPTEGATVARNITLSNTIDANEEKRISFLQPCPKISWAGDLQRDRRFVLNKDSYKSLTIDIFNNERIGGTLNETKAERRLETVGLKYRQVGDVDWSDGFTTIDGENFDLNFVSDQLQRMENYYGYSSLEWNTEHLQQGAYEIMVESECVQVDGSPDLSRFREEIIVGVKDTIRPKQYGKALPLKDNILFGRKIGLIPDFSVLGDVEKFLGKSFRVEIGNENGSLSDVNPSHVFDVNRNSLEHNVKFEKSFLALDLYTVTAKIDVTIDSCPNWSDQEKITELAAVLGLSDSSRIKISSQRCSDGETSFILLITPPTNGRRLRNLFEKDSISDLDSLKFLSKLREMNNHKIVNGRYLQEETQQVKITLVEIIPGKEDRIRLETPVELLREERHLKNIMSFEGDIHHIRENDLPDDIVRNSAEEQSQIELLLIEQQKKLDVMRKEMEEMRKEDAEKMEEMRKEDTEKMEEMRKEDARALKDMQQKEHEEIKEVFMASIAIVVGVVVMIGGAMFMHFRRS